MGRSGRRLIRNDDGAVAPTVALSLVALLAVGGIAFDYAHMGSLDTELQDAADQAALAAATQLDGQANACARAAAAASALLTNTTRFANDGAGANISVTNESACDATGSIRFYQAYDQTTDTPGAAATSATNAKFVLVQVNTRRANYALTPIVGVLSSGNMGAEAVATLGSGGICKVPPLMICNPNEAGGGTFPTAADVGKGLKLEAGGGQTWAPGNYGYLDFGNGANSLEQGMGANNDVEPCVSTSNVSTKPGNTASVPAGINTRFDIYENGLVAYCAQGTGNCSPAVDTIKDVIHPQFSSGSAPNETARTGQGNPDNCAMTGNGPWSLPTKSYQPDSVTRAQPVAIGDPNSMGLPRDICHAISASGDCTNGRFGDGNWDRNLYFHINYGTTGTAWQSLGWLSSWATTNGVTLSSISRYNVYRAEVAAIQAGTLLNAGGTDAKRRLAETRSNGNGNGNGNTTNFYAYGNARCAPAQAATSTIKDRRLLTAAVVNCTAGNVKGSSSITPMGWVDLFLVEPSLNRGTLTGQDQIYVEVKGVATKPNGDSAFQYFLRQRPRLVK